MARKKVDFTVGGVFEEVVEMFKYLDNSISKTFGEDGHDFYAMALGIEKADLIKLKAVKQTNFTLEQIKKYFPTLIFDIAETYEYVVNGNGPTEAFCSQSGVIDCEYSMQWFIEDSVFRTSTFNSWFENSKYFFLHEAGEARANLDAELSLSIKELALLAGVDERTIRNAASAGAFEITKFGSSTIIDNAEARKWLNARPDFKPTKYRNKQIVSGVYTATEFGNFVTMKMEENELTTENVAKEVGVEVNVIVDLEKGIDRINLGHISKLQNLLKIDGNQLLKDFMEIFHPEEYGNLERLFQQTAVVEPNPEEDELDQKFATIFQSKEFSDAIDQMRGVVEPNPKSDVAERTLKLVK